MAGADEFTILLPIDKAELFAAKLDLHDQPLVSWQAYRMRANETLNQVASRVGMSVETLRAVNGIGSRARVPAGHLLLVPAERGRVGAADASLQGAVFTAVPQGRTFFHTVRRGETLSSIARRYGVGTDELRSWNGLSQSAIRAGQQLRVTSDVVTASSPGGRARTAAATRGASTLKTPAKGAAAPAGNAKRAAGADKRGNGKAEAPRPKDAPVNGRSSAGRASMPLPVKSTPRRGAKPATTGASVPSR
jgi:LysM repeat protein